MNKKECIIVTGATRGLGLDFCEYISKLKWNIILIDISASAFKVYKENKKISDIKKKLYNNNELHFFYGDLTIEKNVKRIFKQIKKTRLLPIGLVNFAGGDIKGNDNKAKGGKAYNNNLFISEKDFRNIYNRNYYSTLFMCREYINFLKKYKKGKIVNISSISGTYGVENEFAYSSAKSNIIYLTRSFAQYARKFNITVNCVAPCGTSSARFLKTIEKRGKKDLLRLKKRGLDGFATPKDVSKVVYFLISELSDFVSGQIIRIDGGENSSPL